MEIEDVLKNRRIFSQHAVSFVHAIGTTCIRHLPRLLKVTYSYLEISDAPDETARLNAMDLLECTMTYAWPRLEQHCEDIFKALIKVLCDVSVDKYGVPASVQEILVGKIQKNLTLLKEAVPRHTIPWLEALKNAETNDLCHSVFCAVLCSAEK